MINYNTLPFEIHDIIMSKLCQYGTYKDAIAYGTTSKYHLQLFKQNVNVEKIKAYSHCMHLIYNKNDYKITAMIRTLFPIDFLNGLWMENNCGQLVQAQLFGNQYCIEQIDNPTVDGSGWIPFGFSRYHGFYGFPMSSLVYVELSVVLTFNRPQTNDFKLYAYGQRLSSYESRYIILRKFEISYPVVVDLFSQLENYDSTPLTPMKQLVIGKEQKRFTFQGGCFSVDSLQNTEEQNTEEQDTEVYTKKGVYIKRPSVWTRILKLFSR